MIRQPRNQQPGNKFREWLNGHEWTKQQAARAGIGFTALANGFAATDDPVGVAGDL